MDITDEHAKPLLGLHCLRCVRGMGLSQGIPKEFWDTRFGQDEYVYGTRASRLLHAWADTISANCKTALIPACGEGRDAVFLAQLGLDVTAVDISAEGLAKTQKLAQEKQVDVTTVEADLFQWEWPVATFDLVATMFGHMPHDVRKPLHKFYTQALKPDGLLFLEGFTQDQIDFQRKYNSGGPPDANMLYVADTLADEFENVVPLSMMSGVETLEEGSFHSDPAALIRAVFRKTGNK